MIPGTLNLAVWIGTTLEPVVIQFQDSASVPIDLTGWTAYAEVRESPAGAVIIDLSPAITDASNGEVTITLTDEATAGLAAGSRHWDIMLENPGGERLGPYLRGEFVIQPVTTQP